MEPRYDIKEVEARIYAAWEKSGLFDPDVAVAQGFTSKDAEPFSIVLPPPNVTGELHMGHAAMLVIEDIMVRFARMRGKRALWIPGTDHAAIATQSKVEKMILKAEKKSRHDLGREEFLRRVNEFAAESHDTIVRQVKRMGSSLDWNREAYTFDDKREIAVRTAFKKMYDLGLIYRGNRIVNWDPDLQTTVSDDEIEFVEQKTSFYYLKYGPFTIGTARPETKFGDKYVVMHPADKRYSQYKHGEKIELEWINDPITATIIKDEAIDMEFGTGVMTITPAHSLVDFEIAERHKLDSEQIIDLRGKLLPIAGEFAGQHIKKARPLIIEKLREKGLVEKIDENYTNRVATDSRGGGVIEPQILKQWFVAVNKPFLRDHTSSPGAAMDSLVERKKSLKELMREAVESGETKILPDRFEKVYYHWIDSLRDWCISRQIWFGHRIPVWYCLHCEEARVNAEIKSKWFLIRHGESKFNYEKRSQGQMEGNPLTDLGIAQAEQAAQKLKNEKVDLIISSDLERCKMTAEIISKVTGAKIIFDKKLRERGLGEAEGITREEREKKYGALIWDYAKSIPGGETWGELNMRLVASIEEHSKSHKYKNVVVVTHGTPINFIVGKMRGLMGEEVIKESYPQNADITTVSISEPCSNCGHEFYEQDPDTLDTWFSSGLWPFSTLGWPDGAGGDAAKAKHDLATYFPNSVLETGYDILFFWVARMILMSTCIMGGVPFRRVYLHGLVRDAKGQKMSKSLGNGIDPLEMADKYGADATRLSLIIGASAGNDIKLSEDRIRGYRNFSTKIWNIARFIQMNKPEKLEKISITDREETKELVAIKNEVAKHLEDFEFHLAAEKLYHYIWHTLADKIIEAEKSKLRDGSDAEKSESYALLEHLLLESLTMLHPFMPFITEEIYQIFRPGKILMVEKW